MNRQEHLQWCKDRALEYVDNNDPDQAVASMMSDIGKHPETDNQAVKSMSIGLLMIGKLSTTNQVRTWINGFN